MAVLKKSDLLKMGEEQLNIKLVDVQKELMKANTQIARGTPPENPGQVRELKKTIARIFTRKTLLKKENKDNKKQTKEGSKKV